MKDCCQYVGLLDNKNKAQYEGFKYHNNQRRKELEWRKIAAFFKKVKKQKKNRVWIRRFRQIKNIHNFPYPISYFLKKQFTSCQIWGYRGKIVIKKGITWTQVYVSKKSKNNL